jgi:hypothetical protein
MSASGQVEMSAFGDVVSLGSRTDGPGAGQDEHQGTRPRRRRPTSDRAEAHAGEGRRADGSQRATSPSPLCCVSTSRPNRLGVAQARPAEQPALAASAAGGGGRDRPRALRGLRAQACAGEAARAAPHSGGQGNAPQVDDARRALAAARPATAQGAPAATPARMPGRVGADRRLRARLVRGAWTGVLAAGLRRRRPPGA